MTKEDTQKYELYVLLKPSVIETDIGSLEENTKQDIEKSGFKVKDWSKFVKKELAYPMGKDAYAYAATFIFEGSPGNVEDVESSLKNSSMPVLRYMITKTSSEEIKPKKSLVQPEEKKEDKDEDKEVQQDKDVNKEEEKGKTEEVKDEKDKEKEQESEEDAVTIEDIDKRLDEIMDNL